MNWLFDVKAAESILGSTRVPASEEIISLIKRVNPTSLMLSEPERERGYQMKNRLQNLLLENYGEAFHVVPHPCTPDIILIKHSTLPSIDACHADLTALSAKALDAVGQAGSRTDVPARGKSKASSKENTGNCSPKEVLRDAELLLQQYEYPQAEEMLASLRISDLKDLPVLVKASVMLVEEMGAYQRTIDLLLAQPRQVLKVKAVRELLAVAFHCNDMIPESRALFDAAHPGDLGKNALCACADISFRDGNVDLAYRLVKLCDEKEGYVAALAGLRKDIEAVMLERASPFQDQAEAALAGGDLAQAEELLRKALSLYPDFPRARQLVAELESGRNQALIEKLWGRYEAAETVAERLELLAQLLERDKPGGEKIRDLIASERSRQQRATLEERLGSLRALAAREQWDDCFELLQWFSRQGSEESYRKACQVAPFFSVLHQNKRLQRLPDQQVKELWLGFVRLKSQVQKGSTEGCWELAQDLKPYFSAYPIFKSEFDMLLKLEQEKAWQAIWPLYRQLEELDPQQEEGNVMIEARKLVAQIRKGSQILDAEDGSYFRGAAQAMLLRLEGGNPDEDAVFDYHDALLFGNPAKAAQIREANQDVPGLHFIQVEQEITEKFAIVAEPMLLTIASESEVDLASETAPDGLRLVTSTYRHLVFSDDDESLVIVNMPRQSATRYRSPNFNSLHVMDYLPEEDVFLFSNKENRSTLWRAQLSDLECRFTAVFDITEHFVYEPGASLVALFMSSAKDNAYYAFFGESKGLRGVKQTIGTASCAVSSFELAGAARGAYRLSYQPDRFVVTTETGTAVLEGNLAPVKKCSRVGTGQMLYCVGIDAQNSRIYGAADGITNVLNHKLYAVKQYLKSISMSHLEFEREARICVDKHTLLASVQGKYMFYNMETNEFSQRFSKAHFAHTETPGRWYYWNFDKARDAILLRDITDEVATRLKWQVMIPEEEDEVIIKQFVENLEDPNYFSISPPGGPADVREE